jgi:hypothetical protein
MRLPQPFIDSQFFQFGALKEFLGALGGSVDKAEIREIERISALGLPPITSVDALGVLFGVNTGLLWSILHNSDRYYRRFVLPKGRGFREICAPRVSLKVIQKWISVQLCRNWHAAQHVYGFVPGRSHVDAARVHLGATWVFSVDIANFFGTTPQAVVVTGLTRLGYSLECARLMSDFCCLREVLPQGAPSSPVLSNIAISSIDRELETFADYYGTRLSRYADDIVFSGVGEFPARLQTDIAALFDRSPWRLAAGKTEMSKLPNRLKVHGLLVHGDRIRLTKGYRNRLRAFRHLVSAGRIRDVDLSRVRGHIVFSDFIERN